MKINKGLGRGFEALLSSDFDKNILLDKNETIKNIDIDLLEANPNQPRKHFDQDSLNELSNSIKIYGVIQPIIVTPKSNNKYYIIAGERRYRASKLANLKTVPAIIREQKALEQLEIALIENVQRVDLNPIEQALSIDTLNQQFNLPLPEIAKKLGKAHTTIVNVVRLLKLPDNAKKALIENKISEGHARQILAVSDPKKQDYLLKSIIKDKWTVRKSEQFVIGLKSGIKEVKEAKKQTFIENESTKQLSKRLSAPVYIKRMAHGGKLEIKFKDDQDLERIINFFK